MSDEQAREPVGTAGTPARPGPVPGPPKPGPPKPGPPRPGPPKPGSSGAGPSGAGEPTAGAPAGGSPAPEPADDPTVAAGPAGGTDPVEVSGPPAAEVAVPPVAPASPDPGRWGRVDAEGTVWCSADGTDRAVGSWQAGDAAEGLAHFARRFDDLRAEADLLVRRLQGGQGDARAAARSATGLRERLTDAPVVGDVPALTARLDAVVALAGQADEVERAARAGARDEAVARKEAIITEAVELSAETSRWKHAGDRFAALLEEWKTLRGIDRRTDDALWKRFAKARETFTRRRGTHFAEMDRARTQARAHKEELATEAEGLAGSEDWGPTAGRFRDLMTEWKAAGRTSKDVDDALWERFRTAQDGFFARRSAVFDARDAELASVAEAKEALLVRAESIDLADPDAARAALRDVQDRWEELGRVPRERVRDLGERLAAAEERVRTAADRRWAETDPETQARVGQFRERVAAFETQARKARDAGDRRRAEDAERRAAQWREWLAAAERAAGGDRS